MQLVNPPTIIKWLSNSCACSKEKETAKEMTACKDNSVTTNPSPTHLNLQVTWSSSYKIGYTLISRQSCCCCCCSLEPGGRQWVGLVWSGLVWSSLGGERQGSRAYADDNNYPLNTAPLQSKEREMLVGRVREAEALAFPISHKLLREAHSSSIYPSIHPFLQQTKPKRKD